MTAKSWTRARDLGFEVIGVNSRDLKTLQVDPQVHLELVRVAAGERTARGGERVRTAADVERLLGAGTTRSWWARR